MSVSYEQLLDEDPSWALKEGSMHFERESAVQKTLLRITRRLDELGIPYAVVGGMALFFHGYRRFTEDVDLLVSPTGLQQIHQELEGRGFGPPFPGSRNLRYTDSGVRVEFLVSGQYPGDGKPKPVSFPQPEDAAVEIDGIRFLALPKLIELKLASGISNARRMRDLVDVQELIDVLRLPEELAEELDPSVREKYRELWSVIQDAPELPEL